MLTDKKRILIADVDQKLSARIAEELAKDNYEIREVSDLSDSIDPLELFRPDLIIFDYVINGRDPYRKIQRFWNTYHVPAMIISQDDNVISKVMSLEMGADDYLVKPFDMRELVARVRALLRRSFYTMRTMRKDLDSVEFPDLKISLSKYSAFYKDQIIPMPPKEIELLYFLASSPNQVFTREQLLSQIWGYDYAGDTRTVDVHIKRLRRKLPHSDSWSIETVWGVGYKFQVCS